MRVRDLMETEVVTLREHDTLDLADDVMRLGRIRHFPVVAGDDVLVGILSQRDLFRAAASSLLALRPEGEKRWLAGIPVRLAMCTTVYDIAPDRPVREAVDIMLERKIGCLPVVEDGKLVGLLSESDCLRHLSRLLVLADERQGLPDLSAGG